MSARARVPKTGQGKLVDFRPGQSGNPGGRPAHYHDARKALQAWASERGVERLIALAESPDDRVASVVTLGIMDRAFGKPKEYDPSEDKGGLQWDSSGLTREERVELLALLRKGGLRAADAAPVLPPSTRDIDAVAEEVTDSN